MKDDTKTILALITLVVISLIAGMMLGVTLDKEIYKRSAIKAGVAQYNPTNANFEWLIITNINHK